MVTKSIVFERKEKSLNEDSAQIDIRIINDFIQSHPDSKIITVSHSGANDLRIIYEE